MTSGWSTERRHGCSAIRSGKAPLRRQLLYRAEDKGSSIDEGSLRRKRKFIKQRERSTQRLWGPGEEKMVGGSQGVRRARMTRALEVHRVRPQGPERPWELLVLVPLVTIRSHRKI